MDEWRFWVKLKSVKALKEYMAFHRLPTAYALGQRAGISPGVVGHLLTGRRSTCSLSSAKAIEEALQCPPGFLFAPQMSQIVNNKRRPKGEAA